MTKSLTKDLIVNAYKDKFSDKYKDQTDFKLAIKLLDKFPATRISEGFPDDLLTDNFDLMLDIFAEWNYEKMTETDMQKLAQFIVVNKKDFDTCIENIFYAISTYCPATILDRLINEIKILIDNLAQDFKDEIVASLKNK